ncbi:MAG: hypothetical protein NVSMB21_21390 [Vulcanimicrobiaceae bacterium]
MAFALGLAGATHGIAILLVPSLALVVGARRATLGRRGIFTCAAGLALGLVPYAYLPLRSAWLASHHVDPTLALGLPPGQAFWDYDHPASWHAFVRVVTGADFDVRSGFSGFAEVARYPQFAAAFVTRLGAGYGYACAIAAVAGAALLVARRDRAGIALVVAALLPVPYTEAYTALQDPDRYYSLALWCAAIFIGVAVDALARLVRLERPSIPRYALLGAVAVSFVVADPSRIALFDQRANDGASTYVADIASLVPDGSVVVADWAYATPLAYASYVAKTFGSRIAVAASPRQHLARYRRWLATRGLYVVTFDDALRLPGYAVVPLKIGPYNVYRVAAEAART